MIFIVVIASIIFSVVVCETDICTLGVANTAGFRTECSSVIEIKKCMDICVMKSKLDITEKIQPILLSKCFGNGQVCYCRLESYSRLKNSSVSAKTWCKDNDKDVPWVTIENSIFGMEMLSNNLDDFLI